MRDATERDLLRERSGCAVQAERCHVEPMGEQRPVHDVHEEALRHEDSLGVCAEKSLLHVSCERAEIDTSHV